MKSKGTWEPHDREPKWKRGFLLKRWHLLYPLHRQLGSGLFAEYSIGELFVWFVLLALCALGFVDSGGGMADVLVLLTFITVQKNSLVCFWVYTTGMPFERILIYHKACAWFATATGAWHGYKVGSMLSGWGLIISMGCLLLFSISPIRRNLFEFFYRFHWVAFLTAIASGVKHASAGCVIGGGILAFDHIIDWARNFKRSGSLRHTRVLKATRLPSDVVSLSFPKSTIGKDGNPVVWQYTAGQYIFIQVPELSNFEWHPFSISTAPSEDHVSVHIRVLGNWTKKLYELVSERTKEAGLENGNAIQLVCSIDGPYGEPAVEVNSDRYQVFVLFSGGIGITPMQSIANDLLNQHEVCKLISLSLLVSLHLSSLSSHLFLFVV